MNKRIAVLVSGGGTNLQALLDAQSRGEIIYLSGTELPKSFLLCESDGVGRVYVSHLAPSTLRRRVENTAAALR